MPLIDSSLFVLLFWAVAAYLIGSVPFGMVLTRAMNLGDLRSIGSGNIGATNVLRTGSKKAAALTLILDGGKGAVAVLLARLFAGEDAAPLGCQNPEGCGVRAAITTHHGLPHDGCLHVLDQRRLPRSVRWRP